MAIKHIISPGIGFSPGKVQYIVTRGFGVGIAIPTVESGGAVKLKKRKQKKSKLTPEQIKGLENFYGKAPHPMDDIPRGEPVPTAFEKPVFTPPSPFKEITPKEIFDSSKISVLKPAKKGILKAQEETEEFDELMIMAMIETHNP